MLYLKGLTNKSYQKMNQEEMKQKVQEALKDKQTVNKAIDFCQKAGVITKEQIQQSMNNRSKQIKLMAKAVAWYLNQKEQ